MHTVFVGLFFLLLLTSLLTEARHRVFGAVWKRKPSQIVCRELQPVARFVAWCFFGSVFYFTPDSERTSARVFCVLSVCICVFRVPLLLLFSPPSRRLHDQTPRAYAMLSRFVLKPC